MDLLQQTRDSLPLIMPQVMLVFFGIAILLLDFLLDRRHKWLNAVAAMLGVFFSGWALWNLHSLLEETSRQMPFRSVWSASLTGFNETLIVDSFFIFFGFLFLGSTALVILLSARYLEIEGEHCGEYYALMLFATVGMMFMASGRELVMLFIGLETMAISFYILAGFLRRDRRSNEGALKYLLLGAFSSGILAYGFSLLYGLTGTTRLDLIQSRFLGMGAAGELSNPLAILAMVTIAAGLFFKVAAVPFHQWAPDVYEGAPTSITAYVSVASKAASFALLLRIFGSVFSVDPLRENWELLFTIVAVATMTLGNFAALTQTNVKRLLAYSSIAHVGYILLGLVAGNRTGLAGISFYLLAYLFMNTGAFALVIILRRQGLIGDELEDMNGLYQRSPAAAVLLLIFMLSLAGIPPTAGFIGKYFIFLALIEAKRYVLAAIAVLYIVPALYYYFRIVRHAWMGEITDPVRPAISLGQAAALAITGFFTLYLGLLPNDFIAFAQKSIFFLGP